MVVKAPKEGET
jgi:hypothetical protein